MSKIKNKLAKEACKKISVDKRIPKKIIEEILYQYYHMIATDIRNLDKKDEETILNFNLPCLGKLYVSDYKRKKLKEYNDKSEN